MLPACIAVDHPNAVLHGCMSFVSGQPSQEGEQSCLHLVCLMTRCTIAPCGLLRIADYSLLTGNDERWSLMV